jgi:radical SAM protein with 4Fe4S-binding SPASM domain
VTCDYCFENKTGEYLPLDRLSLLIQKVLDYMEQTTTGSLTIYWQGGEIMTLPPQWFEQAYGMIQSAAEARNKHIQHSLQSNMIGYGKKWNKIIAEMFGNNVGTSMDFPNLHRKLFGRSPQAYSAIWSRNVREAREAGIQVGVIAVPNRGTLGIGAERFYSHFVDDLQVTDFQVNTPFPGGEQNEVKKGLPLDIDQLSEFFVDLANVWIERGYHQGVRLGPVDELLKYFTHQNACLPCIWRQNCADEIVSIDARGYVAQCDCWVTSYPEYYYGNIFESNSLSELLQKSKARQDFYDRPMALVQQQDCLECDYLSLCHGGCPVRTYTFRGTLFDKDPYCSLYKVLFKHMEEMAAQVARDRSRVQMDALWLPMVSAY